MRRGFTLVELLISITIFVFLTTVTVFSFRGVGFANSIRSNGSLVVSSLRQIQAKAIAGTSIQLCENNQTHVCRTNFDCDPSGIVVCNAPIVPAGGYGFRTASTAATSFDLFANLQATGVSGNDIYDPTNDAIIENGSVSLTDKTKVMQAVVIFFSPLTGKIATTPPGVPLNFCVGSDSVSNVFRVVTVNSITGLIDDNGATSCL